MCICFVFFLFVKVYPKLAQSYFLLLECLAQDHMTFLSTLDPAIFLYIIKSISEGLAAEGMTNLTSSDAAGDLSNRAIPSMSYSLFVILVFVFLLNSILFFRSLK